MAVKIKRIRKTSEEINMASVSDIVFLLLNTPVFNNFLGTFNASGQSVATLTSGPIPGASGLVMYYAYAIAFPYDFASNAVTVTFVP